MQNKMWQVGLGQLGLPVGIRVGHAFEGVLAAARWLGYASPGKQGRSDTVGTMDVDKATENLWEDSELRGLWAGYTVFSG